MASLRCKSDTSGDAFPVIFPEKRFRHECALVDGHLYLFGGRHGSKYFLRSEIFVMNVRKAKTRWIRRRTQGRTTPPPCQGARCVVINEMIYSYGGETQGGRLLGIVYRLDPKTMEWIEVATPVGGKKPHERSYCCLCAIGSRMIMIGGYSEKKVPLDELQRGATQDQYNWSNDIYEFEFDEEIERGMWLDLEIGGTRPKPLLEAAMTAIDQHRALLHGRDVNRESHSFLLNLANKTWEIIDFNVKPSPREGHAICHLVMPELKDESLCLLVGGRMLGKSNSDYIYVLDCDNSKAYKMDVDSQLGKVRYHTCHCVQNEDRTADILVCGGRDSNSWVSYRPIVVTYHLDIHNESYMKIQHEILSSRFVLVSAASPPPRPLLSSEKEPFKMMQRELEHLRRKCSQLAEEKTLNATRFDEEKASIKEELSLSAQLLAQSKNEETAQLKQKLSSAKCEAEAAERRCAEEVAFARRELVSAEHLLERKDKDIAAIRRELAFVRRRHREDISLIREEKAVALARCETLEASRDEMKRRLDEFTDVLSIDPDDVYLSDKNLGSGSFAGVTVGQWRGVTVAVKKIHDLITSQRNVAMFRREVLVCSRLHHPHIMVVCGAVIAEGAPLQIVMELLEGSVGEVIDAAHATGSYLTVYEQLSIAMDITSGIAYLHQIRPRPYVHGDIRPSNVLVARDMKVKVGDLGAAHIIESSLSAGPMSPPYLAPERVPQSDIPATSSTLSSDMYSVGVSLIEIFTGLGPIPEERQTQLDALAERPNLFMLCSCLIRRIPTNRMSAQRCFETLRTSLTERERGFSAKAIVSAKRLVKGVFEEDHHKVILLTMSIK